MPTKVRKLPGKNKYRVSTPTKTHAKSTTREKASAQKRILDTAELNEYTRAQLIKKAVRETGRSASELNRKTKKQLVGILIRAR